MGIFLRRHRWALVRLWVVTSAILWVCLRAPELLGTASPPPRRAVALPAPAPVVQVCDSAAAPAKIEQVELWVNEGLWREAAHELEGTVAGMGSVAATRWLEAEEQRHALAQEFAAAGIESTPADLDLKAMDLPRALLVELAPGATPDALAVELKRETLTRKGLHLVPESPKRICKAVVAAQTAAQPSSQTKLRPQSKSDRPGTSLRALLVIPMAWGVMVIVLLNGLRSMIAFDRERIEVSLFLGAEPRRMRLDYLRAGGTVALAAVTTALVVETMLAGDQALAWVGPYTLPFVGMLFALCVSALALATRLALTRQLEISG